MLYVYIAKLHKCLKEIQQLTNCPVLVICHSLQQLSIATLPTKTACRWPVEDFWADFWPIISPQGDGLAGLAEVPHRPSPSNGLETARNEPAKLENQFWL